MVKLVYPSMIKSLVLDVDCRTSETMCGRKARWALDVGGPMCLLSSHPSGAIESIASRLSGLFGLPVIYWRDGQLVTVMVQMDSEYLERLISEEYHRSIAQTCGEVKSLGRINF